MRCDFYSELDALISKHRLGGYDLGELIADLEGAVAGLREENENEDDEAVA